MSLYFVSYTSSVIFFTLSLIVSRILVKVPEHKVGLDDASYKLFVLLPVWFVSVMVLLIFIPYFGMVIHATYFVAMCIALISVIVDGHFPTDMFGNRLKTLFRILNHKINKQIEGE